MTTTDVLVIGAGPTGLTIANVLMHNGVSVRILDKKSGPTQESRAVVIHAKTLELLDHLGLTDEMIVEGEHFRSFQIFRQGERSGKLAFRSDRGIRRTPYPFALIYGQDHTEHLLLQRLTQAGYHIEWNTEMLSLEQSADAVKVRVRAADGQDETIESRWVVGADGAHSVVRHMLSMNFAGRGYGQSLFVADLDVEGELAPKQGIMDLTREGFFLFVPMRGEKRFRLFGTLPPALADREQITLDDVQQVLATYSGLHVTIPRARWTSVYRTHLRIVEHFRRGRVFLAGDAAHIHSPAGGQGMNTGIGDAYNLAWKLALVVKGQAHETLLDSYEAERMPFAHAILNESDMAFQLMTTTRPSVRWLKMHVAPLLLNMVTSLPPVQKRAFWLLSQLWTDYRSSTAVKDAGPREKGPRAGDRAPYGFFEAGPYAGKSVFSLLKNQDHHLFLFAGKGKRSLVNMTALAKDVQAQLDAYSTPVHLHIVSVENHILHELYGAQQPTLFLLRPDGHIAYRGGAEDGSSLKAYLDGVFKNDTIPARASDKTRQPLYH